MRWLNRSDEEEDILITYNLSKSSFDGSASPISAMVKLNNSQGYSPERLVATCAGFIESGKWVGFLNVYGDHLATIRRLLYISGCGYSSWAQTSVDGIIRVLGGLGFWLSVPR